MSDFITPTVGRVVWFYPSNNVASSGFAPPSAGQPLAAVIARVWNDRMVNLTVFDANGVSHSRTSVTLLQDGDHKLLTGNYCTWMPFQKGQARAQAAAQADSAVASDSCKAQSTELAAKSLTINQRVNDALKAATTGAASQRLGRRDELEQSLVSGASHALAGNPENAKNLAEGIKEFLNVLHPQTPPPNPQVGVLYQAICNAMGELGALHPGFNDHVNRAWNYLHRAFWSEVPAPASAPGLRDELPAAESGIDLSPTKQQDAVEQVFQAKGATSRATPAIVRETIDYRRHMAFEQVEAHVFKIQQLETKLASERYDHRSAVQSLAELDRWITENPAPARAA